MLEHYLQMSLFKPRSSPDALLGIEDESTLFIGQIYKIIVDKDNMTAIFNNRHSYNKSKRLTGWEANRNLPKPLVFFSVFISTYDEDFARKFIVTHPFMGQSKFYSDFLLKPNADNLQMKLTLLNRNQKGLFKVEESFAIPNISRITFSYGIFTAHFASKKAFQRAKSLTDWPNEKGKFSLQIPIKKRIKNYSVEIM